MIKDVFQLSMLLSTDQLRKLKKLLNKNHEVVVQCCRNAPLIELE